MYFSAAYVTEIESLHVEFDVSERYSPTETNMSIFKIFSDVEKLMYFLPHLWVKFADSFTF